ncbi:hypothetical protein K7432_002234 [Basidiobolus ranarum]|uniref:Arrestin-like N-terminal domain-containing protein n=1 Tax=Basidiobolus ranarum TaxID=34480 RepID=A0ABR2W843_9FUNG
MGLSRPKAPSLELRVLGNTVLVNEESPDSCLHGSLELKLFRPLKIHSIHMVLKGVFTTKLLSGLWENQETRCTSTCVILERQGTEYYLGSGEYSYNCVVKIPSHTDQTTITNIGKIEYRLYGIIETMGFQQNLIKSVPIYIQRTLPRCTDFGISSGLWKNMLRYQVMLSSVDYTLDDSLSVIFRLESLVDVFFSWKLSVTLNESVGYYRSSKNGKLVLKKSNRVITKTVGYSSEASRVTLSTLSLPVTMRNAGASYDCHGKYLSISHQLLAKIEMVNDNRHKFISILPIRLVHPDALQWLDQIDFTPLPSYASLDSEAQN